MYKHFFFILMMGLILNPISGFSQKTISIESLLKEMVDRSEQARFPEPAFTCKQFSSYDRASVSKDAPGWYANKDCSMFIRIEKNQGRREFVMMEAEGPGAIVRWWMTLGGNNSVRKSIMRIYIDDYSKPAIEGNPFDIISGTLVAVAPLATSVPGGHNLYFPIPYAKRCKVTYESDNMHETVPEAFTADKEKVYYNINYRTYEQSVQVVSYSAQEVKKNKTLIDNVQKQLKNKERGTEKMKLARLPLNTQLKAGESKSFTIQGMYAIRQLEMEIKAANQNQALRSTVLEIAFDGEKTVWSPVGDFFGIGYMPLYTNTWYTRVEKGGLMSAFWVMPFEKECVITLHNLGQQDVTVSDASAGYNRWQWDKRSMHFGTAWQQFTRIYASPNVDQTARDLNFATLRGKGVYVGDGLALFNTSYAWWGEGDEKIYVDGETFPSHFGTGSEDYYGYGWGIPTVFTDHPYIAQPSGEGNTTPGYTVNIRYRGLDGIPFTQSLALDMELWHHAPKTKINFAPNTYWYMIPGGKNLTNADVSGVAEPVIKRREEIYSDMAQIVIEGENLILTAAKGKIEFQTNIRLWSGYMQLFWRDIEKGYKADFEFTSPCAGTFDFTGLFTIASEYGAFNIYVNGQKVASDLDLYNPVVEVKSITLGKVNLQSGKNAVTFELTGYAKDRDKASFGIDKLIFSK